MELFAGFVGLAIACLAIVVGVLWIFVPFAVFGIKPLLQQLIAQQRRTNQLLEHIATQQQPPIP